MATARTTEPLDPAYTARIPGIPDPEPPIPTIDRIVAQDLAELKRRRAEHAARTQQQETTR